MSSISIFPGRLQENIQQQFSSFAAHSVITRLWKKDYTIWRSEEVHRKSILNRLGWLDSLDLMIQNIDALNSFGAEIRDAGFKHVVVLGMGGSSLCPDVCRATFGSAPGYPQLLVLDSTNPVSVARIERQIDLAHTLFIVASKSGGTTETNMFYKYFFDRVGTVIKNPGNNFVAVTDADTKMESIAKEQRFRKIFVNPADIGGRYSALSYFGLVPMALIGMDLKKLVASADEMRKQCRFEAVQNPGAEIGLLMGEAHNEGLNKLTLMMSKEISSFAYWAEQLIAESTGKEGKGILPIEGESVSLPFEADRYGSDRIFVFIVTEEDAIRYSAAVNDLAARNIPYALVTIRDRYELGAQFFLWEFATAVSAVLLKINPFDEPNVKESKDNTVQVIEEYKQQKSLPVNPVVRTEQMLTIHAQPEYSSRFSGQSVSGIIKTHCSGRKGEDYVALLAYIDQNPENEKMLGAIREELWKIYGLPVTVGFGPRYLHSTGQLHKGGGPSGIFIIITADEPTDLNIPGEPFSFGILKQAQALGDYRSFANKQLRMIHIHMSGTVSKGLYQLSEAIVHYNS
jgi:transaldolase/glucose-6-phosphate isomerase